MSILLLAATSALLLTGSAAGLNIHKAKQCRAKKQKLTRPGDCVPALSDARRREVLRAAAFGVISAAGGIDRDDAVATAAGTEDGIDAYRTYNQRFPTLFDPLYGRGRRRTIKRQLGPGIWSLEQNLQLGPLQTPIRCVVIRLERDGGGLWVHAPLAPTAEFFDLAESCGGEDDAVRHVVVPSYALEHKAFVRDALERWPDAKLWTSPGQFSFPVRSVSERFVFGKEVDGVLPADRGPGDGAGTIPPWADEIEYETLAAGTFNIGGAATTLYETAFFHKRSKSLIVTDAVARIGGTVPELNDPALLLLVSKRSTSDPLPGDTPAARLMGWEKTALLVSYFFPEHEELDPDEFGVVTWTDGWEDNFRTLSGRLLVPPVVRTLLYAQDPGRVREWVDRVSSRWDFDRIVPAHFDAPVEATPDGFRRAFAFLEDDGVDAFPENDLARGLRPVADFALGRLAASAK